MGFMGKLYVLALKEVSRNIAVIAETLRLFKFSTSFRQETGIRELYRSAIGGIDVILRYVANRKLEQGEEGLSRG